MRCILLATAIGLGSILFHTLNPALSLPDQSLRLLIYSVSTVLTLLKEPTNQAGGRADRLRILNVRAGGGPGGRRSYRNGIS